MDGEERRANPNEAFAGNLLPHESRRAKLMAAEVTGRMFNVLFFVLVGVLCLVGANREYRELKEARALMVTGRQVEGKVTDVSLQGRDYEIAYSFRVDGRPFLVHERPIPRSEYGRLSKGTKITVWYDPRDPKESITAAELVELESWSNRIGLPLFGLVSICVGLAFLRKRAAHSRSKTSR